VSPAARTSQPEYRGVGVEEGRDRNINYRLQLHKIKHKNKRRSNKI